MKIHAKGLPPRPEPGVKRPCRRALSPRSAALPATSPCPAQHHASASRMSCLSRGSQWEFSVASRLPGDASGYPGNLRAWRPMSEGTARCRSRGSFPQGHGLPKDACQSRGGEEPKRSCPAVTDLESFPAMVPTWAPPDAPSGTTPAAQPAVRSGPSVNTCPQEPATVPQASHGTEAPCPSGQGRAWVQEGRGASVACTSWPKLRRLRLPVDIGVFDKPRDDSANWPIAQDGGQGRGPEWSQQRMCREYPPAGMKRAGGTSRPPSPTLQVPETGLRS